MSLFVNRADLAWALNAVIPHVGSKAEGLDQVGFQIDNCWPELSLYATDHYTLAIADLDFHTGTPLAGADFALPVKEAKDLLRMVRPTLKRHESEEVELLVVVNLGSTDPGSPQELHVALAEPEDDAERETAVFEVVTPGMGYDRVERRLKAIHDAEIESLSEHPDLPFNPDFAARFAKAQRYNTDRLILSPRMMDGLNYGASYVTVGSHFEGAIAGLTYSAPDWVQEAEQAA